MSVRDGMLNWKPEAVRIVTELEAELSPMLVRVLNEGMTKEDFFYLVHEAARSVELSYIRKMKNKHEGC